MMIFDRLVLLSDYAMRSYMRLRSANFKARVVTVPLGFKVLCDTRDFIQRRVFYFGIFEHNLTYYIIDSLSPGDCFVDVGANIGYMTLLASTSVGPGGRVIAIEASPRTFQALTANLDLNHCTNVQPINMAVLGGPGVVQIEEVDAKNSGAARVKTAGEGDAGVPGDALTTILGRDAAEVVFIKIDIEGSEEPVLEDLLRNLDRYPKLKRIAVELREPGAAFVDRFRAVGFRAFGLHNDYRIEHYLVRSYLEARGQGRFITKAPLDAYDGAFTDYVFERGA
jgi:FkbM family methyltransferase